MMILWVCVRAHLAVLDALGMDKALINVEVFVRSGPDGCLRVKVQSRCLFHFSFAGSLRLALYDECESCPGQVNSKQLRSAACTACSVSVIHSFISLQQSPPLRSTRILILTHFSISLSLSRSIFLPSPSFVPSPSLFLVCDRTSLSQTVCVLTSLFLTVFRSILFPLCLPRYLSFYWDPGLNLCRSRDGYWKCWIPGLPRRLSGVDSWQMIRVRVAARTGSYLLTGLEDCTDIGRSLRDGAKKPLGCFV